MLLILSRMRRWSFLFFVYAPARWVYKHLQKSLNRFFLNRASLGVRAIQIICSLHQNELFTPAPPHCHVLLPAGPAGILNNSHLRLLSQTIFLISSREVRAYFLSSIDLLCIWSIRARLQICQFLNAKSSPLQGRKDLIWARSKQYNQCSFSVLSCSRCCVAWNVEFGDE